MYPEYLSDQGVKPWMLNMDCEFRGVKFGDISEFISCIKYQKLSLNLDEKPLNLAKNL